MVTTKRKADELFFVETQEPRSSSPVSPFQAPVPFPPAPYLQSATNYDIVQQFNVRRKPIPWTSSPDVRELEALSEEDILQSVVRQSSWPLTGAVGERSITTHHREEGGTRVEKRSVNKRVRFGSFSRHAERGHRQREMGRGRTASLSRKPLPMRLAELQGRAVTSDELLISSRPGSAPLWI
ncbi:hypothetical protein P280DRAFT_469364, partial [Massarina eburnea CBS 473.64]